jgi:hypothetical protein
VLRRCLSCLHSIRLRVHTPPPSDRHPLLGPNFNLGATRGFPSHRFRLWLQDPGRPIDQALFLPEPPNVVPGSRSTVCHSLGGLPPNPAGTWRLPHPPPPSWILGQSQVLEPNHLPVNSPRGKSLFKQGPGRRQLPQPGSNSPRTPISALGGAPQRPGARPAPTPGALILGISVGQGHPTGPDGGVAVQGARARRGQGVLGSEESGRGGSGQGPGARRDTATGQGWPGDTAAPAGGRGCYQHVCVRGWGWG